MAPVEDLMSEIDPFDEISFKLPPHRKCACHLLCRVAVADIKKATSNEIWKNLQVVLDC